MKINVCESKDIIRVYERSKHTGSKLDKKVKGLSLNIKQICHDLMKMFPDIMPKIIHSKILLQYGYDKNESEIKPTLKQVLI